MIMKVPAGGSPLDFAEAARFIGISANAENEGPFGTKAKDGHTPLDTGELDLGTPAIVRQLKNPPPSAKKKRRQP